MGVLYIDIDSLRLDHTTPYGYEKEMTPNIARLAEDSVIFDCAYVAASPCMPSRSGALTGRYGIDNGVVTHGAQGRTLNDLAMWDNWNGDRRVVDTSRDVLPRTDADRGDILVPSPPAAVVLPPLARVLPASGAAGDGEYFQTPRAETVADLAAAFVEDAHKREHLVFEHGLYTAQRAVRTGHWKLIQTYNSGLWDLPADQLFDIEADPWEQTNVADDHPEVVSDLVETMAVGA